MLTRIEFNFDARKARRIESFALVEEGTANSPRPMPNRANDIGLLFEPSLPSGARRAVRMVAPASRAAAATSAMVISAHPAKAAWGALTYQATIAARGALE